MQVLAHRCAVVNHRIDQMLKGEFWSLPVACVECSGCRETAASTFALDTDTSGIQPELACIRVQPSEDRVDVLYWRRVRCFRREAMIDGIDRASQRRRATPIFQVLQFCLAQHDAPATTAYH